MKGKIRILYHRCQKCGGKLAETIIGEEWCPRCVGREMAEEAAKKLKLDLGLPTPPEGKE